MNLQSRYRRNDPRSKSGAIGCVRGSGAHRPPGRHGEADYLYAAVRPSVCSSEPIESTEVNAGDRPGAWWHGTEQPSGARHARGGYIGVRRRRPAGGSSRPPSTATPHPPRARRSPQRRQAPWTSPRPPGARPRRTRRCRRKSRPPPSACVRCERAPTRCCWRRQIAQRRADWDTLPEYPCVFMALLRHCPRPLRCGAPPKGAATMPTSGEEATPSQLLL